MPCSIKKVTQYISELHFDIFNSIYEIPFFGRIEQRANVFSLAPVSLYNML